MKVLHSWQSVLWITCLAILSSLSQTHALANTAPKSNPFKDLLFKGSAAVDPATSSPPSLAMSLNAQQFLTDLQLTSDIEPEQFKSSPQNIPNLLTASVPAVLRAASGVFGLDYKIEIVPKDDSKYTYLSIGNYQLKESCSPLLKQPQQPLILYEFESCPFCRIVREACSILSLTVTFRPVPKGGRKFRPEIKNKYGKSATFPFLIDPNTSVSMFESTDIIKYLFATYGGRRDDNIPRILQPSLATTLTAGLGVGLARLGAGGAHKDSNPNLVKRPLVVWGYEGSPFCKIVREALCEKELEHTVIFTPRGSPNRQTLWELTKSIAPSAPFFQVPLLQDPNTGVCLFESEAIVEYIDKVYGIEQSPVEFL